MKITILLLACLTTATLYGQEITQIQATQEAPEVDSNDQFDVRVKGLSGHKPMYFLLGYDPVVNAKFQLSFKYRFINSDVLSEKTEFLSKLYLGYTQKSFWDLESDSFPFRDNNYNPEFFYLNRDIFQGSFGEHVRMDFQSGYEHESNGQDGIESRSWDRLYIMPSWVFGDTEGYQFTVAPKLWAIIAEGDELDVDMADYYGYGELYFRYGKRNSLVMDLMLRKGMEDSHGAVRFNVSYPMNRMFKKHINLFLFGQAYYGEGEAMVSLEQHSTNLRLGVGLYR